MRNTRLLLFVPLLSLAFFSCKKADDTNKVEVTGTLQKTVAITTYQYGTHFIEGFAVRSGSIDLDNYVNQYVTVIGQKIEGYPVENGPEYLEVEEVR